MIRIYIAILAALLSVSCERSPGPVIIDLTGSAVQGAGVFILNEGNFRAGNGSLSFFSYDSAKVMNHLFSEINKYPLGDVPYSMEISGDRAYIIVNNSGKIEVVMANTLESVKTISGLNSPRYIGFLDNNKAYVTSLWSDSVTIIDLQSLLIEGYINIRRSSEAIAVAGYQAFIASWAGSNEIMVINTMDNSVADSIIVGSEPESMVVDKNNTLWVLCNGGWARENFAEMVAIDTQTGEIVKRFVFPKITDSPTCLKINKNGDSLYYLHKGVRRMSVTDPELPADVLIPETGRLFYKLGVFPDNGDIFVTDVVDYQSKGYVLRYQRNGLLISVMESDIIPGALCYKVLPD
jgi:YVTN family beta-propeller protein